ncbi:hypothetical protein MS3_00000730 [Schistosoma haematobium]|uniref:Egg protein CP391S-like protein n=1 Tax=Schistosoma haematobium TaxID=6185 RepID=A0A922IJE2_SCHHA|nr:hypothetical protein MS3_00000730 [Schistosoma haematobium]KAH9580796.1 hypothetical protein MS3_00000730 [Schistosoma haematobium]
MVRYGLKRDLLIRFSLIVNLFPKFFSCQDICEPDWKNYKKVIFENASYRYSLYHAYTERIQLNQSNPLLNGELQVFTNDEFVEPKFPFKYYDTRINIFNIFPSGLTKIYTSVYVGQITNRMVDTSYYQFELLDRKDVFAVKVPFVKTVNDTEVTAKTIYLIHPNGKISFYYENIPMEVEESKRQSKISRKFVCGSNNTDYEIIVPGKWIRTGTLVEYEAIGTICQRYNSTESCRNATTWNMTCIWCEKANTCIESNDHDTHDLKLSDCCNKNMTTGMIEVNKQIKPFEYLFVGIPLIISLLLACIGCAIWRWRHKRKNVRF